MIRFAIFATSLMHDKSSRLSDDPLLFRHGFDVGSLKDKVFSGLKRESEGDGESFSGDLNRAETLKRLSDGSFRFRSNGLFWIDRMFQKITDSDKLSKINGSLGSLHGEN